MENTRSINQDSLLTLLVEKTSNVEVSNNILAEIKTSCNNYSLDYDKVAGEICNAIRVTTEIRSIRGFCNGVIKKIISNNKDQFTKKWKTICFNDFNRKLDSANIKGTTGELFLIHEIEEHCLNEFNVKPEELAVTNTAIIEYCKVHKFTTLEKFTELLLKSKIVSKCNIPIVVLKKRAYENGELWDKNMKELEEY